MKTLKILHTADWHLGQTFFEFDRTYEHEQFLEWLLQVLAEKEIDVLLICGDVFDVSNPSAASMRLFYDFLRKASLINTHLQIVVIAGNHDSPSRLEMPKPLLEAFNIFVIGNIESEGELVNYNGILVPLHDRQGIRRAWCVAMPFIRACDFPSGMYNGSNLSESISKIYEGAYKSILDKKEENEAVIALGHLHVMNAEISVGDKSERPLLGGLEFVPLSAFHDDIAYVALGHIHKAQRIGARDHIRYAGSPLPMSFSEINYKHQVVVVELDNAKCAGIEVVEVPQIVELLRVPSKHKNIDEVLTELQKLPVKTVENMNNPLLEVRVLLDGPEPALRQKVDAILENKQVRLARIDVKYLQNNTEKSLATYDQLQELQPFTVFQKIYKKKFQQDVPDVLTEIFNKTVEEVRKESL